MDSSTLFGSSARPGHPTTVMLTALTALVGALGFTSALALTARS